MKDMLAALRDWLLGRAPKTRLEALRALGVR